MTKYLHQVKLPAEMPAGTKVWFCAYVRMTVSTEHRYVVRDEQILSGEPIIAGTRTPVRAIIEAHRILRQVAVFTAVAGTRPDLFSKLPRH